MQLQWQNNFLLNIKRKCVIMKIGIDIGGSHIAVRTDTKRTYNSKKGKRF